MADTLLSIALEKLASVVEQQIEQEVRVVVGVKKEVEYITKLLRTIRAVVADAEKRQVTDERVEVWLERLKDVAYQMDDVVDEWSTAILKLQIEVTSSSCCSDPFICFKQVALRCNIALKIKSIKGQLDEIERERIRLDFVSSSRSDEEQRPQRLITTSAIDIAEVCGRDMDRDTILDHLLMGRTMSRSTTSASASASACQVEKEKCKEGLYIISIVGAGGMGKTTLSHLAYNHPDVKAHFDKRIWVCVSDPFEPKRVYRAIVEALTEESSDLHDLKALQQKIQTCIAGKKFLLVLDDVWTDESPLWEQLKNTLIGGEVGSTILVTTRKETVATMMGTVYMHSLGQLPKEPSRALFHQIAFFGKSTGEKEELKGVGEKIAEECKGLPLAIKNLDKVKDAAEAEEAKLRNKMHLHHLSFGFDHKEEGTKGVADALQPPSNLKSLSVCLSVYKQLW